MPGTVHPSPHASRRPATADESVSVRPTPPPSSSSTLSVSTVPRPSSGARPRQYSDSPAPSFLDKPPKEREREHHHHGLKGLRSLAHASSLPHLKSRKPTPSISPNPGGAPPMLFAPAAERGNPIAPWDDTGGGEGTQRRSTKDIDQIVPWLEQDARPGMSRASSEDSLRTAAGRSANGKEREREEGGREGKEKEKEKEKEKKRGILSYLRKKASHAHMSKDGKSEHDVYAWQSPSAASLHESPMPNEPHRSPSGGLALPSTSRFPTNASSTSLPSAVPPASSTKRPSTTSSKPSKRLGSSAGKGRPAPPSVPPEGDVGFSLDTDLTHMEGILAGHRDPRPPSPPPQPLPPGTAHRPSRAPSSISSASAGPWEERSSVSSATSRAPSGSLASGRKRPSDAVPPLFQPPTFMGGPGDDKRRTSSATHTAPPSYAASPPSPKTTSVGGGKRHRKPSQLTERFARHQASISEEAGHPASEGAYITHFPATSDDWRINQASTTPVPFVGPTPPSPGWWRDDRELQLGGIRTPHNAGIGPPGAPPANAEAAWQAPESWGIGGGTVPEYEDPSSEEEAMGEEAVAGTGFGDGGDAGAAALRSTRTPSDWNPVGPFCEMNGSTMVVDGKHVRLGQQLRQVSTSNSPRPGTAGSMSMQPGAGRSGNYHLRVYKSDGTYLTLSCGLWTTASELSQVLARKLRVQTATYQLYIRERMKERAMGPQEKPVLIQRRRLEQVGFTDADRIEDIGKEDLGFLCRFIFRLATVAHFDAEDEEAFGNFEFIDLQSKNLQTVPIFLYQHAHRIISLNLSKNPMTDLPLDFIQLCTSMRELKLSSVAIKRLPSSVRQCATLTRLDISCNRIVELDHAGFDDMPELTSVKAQNNRLATLPECFAGMTGLKYLNISNNKFDTFPAVLCEMRSLVEVDVSFNTITTLPHEIGQLEHLERLVIVGNSLASLPATFDRLVNLRELDVRRNSLTDIAIACSLPKLEILKAEHNLVRVLDALFGPRVQSLNVSDNPLTRFTLATTNRGEPAMVTYLNLSKAKLTSIQDDAFAHLPHLEYLILDYNQFTALPEALGKLSSLVELSCTNNLLSAVPESVGRLQRLRTLAVHNNNLKFLPSALWWCPQLELLSASSNLIESFPDPPLATEPATPGVPGAVQQQATMAAVDGTERKLSASSTLMGPPGTPSGRPSLPLARALHRLLLADNRLTDDVFHPVALLFELRVLNVSFNEIDEIPSHRLGKNTALEELYLSGNNLRSLPAEDLERLSRLKILNLNSNKLQVLPAELGKIAKLHVLDVGSNRLKYNIANWGYDWNWNWNLDLRYLNLSGNKRLEIREVKDPDRLASASSLSKLNLAEFSALKDLRVLGLMDVTLRVPSLPDENENRRVRTSLATINDMAYGIADSIGELENLSMCDFVVPRFRGRDDECLFGLFDGKLAPNTDGCRLSRFLHDAFEQQIAHELAAVSTEEIPDALRRAFLRLNKRFFDNILPGLVGIRRKASNVSEVTPLTVVTGDKGGRNASVVSANSVLAVVSTPSGSPREAPEMGMFEVKSGASAIVVYMTGKTMYVANAGDALAVVSRKGAPYLVSTMHEPLERSETIRIRAAEGWVSPKGLINDELDVSKSFGFFHLLPAVNARPSVHRVDLTDADEFIIIANRGLWDHVSYETAVDIARTEREDPMLAAQKLRDFAIGYGAKGNTMVMVVAVADLFQPRGPPGGAFGPGFADVEGYYAAGSAAKRVGPRRTRDEHGVGDRTLARLQREVPPPIGHVALVFTDIKNSTTLWETNGGMQSAMRIHNSLLRRHLRTIGGYEVKTEGDAFMVSFPTTTSALLWCFTIQLQLLTQDWPKEILECEDGRPVYDADGSLIARGLSVRMGLHVGYPVCEADPVTQRMDYFGPMVNRSARVSAVAEGGQIMASADVVSEVQAQCAIDPNSEEDDELSSDVRRDVAALRRIGFGVLSVGERRLKGLEVPERLSLLYPIQLKGRVELPDKNLADAVDGATPARVYEPTVQIFDIEELRQFSLLCIRIEALAAGLVYRDPASLRKDSLAPSTPSSATVSPRRSIADAPPSGSSPYQTISSALLVPPIPDGASDEELFFIFQSLLARFENAINTMYLRELGDFSPVLAALTNATRLEPGMVARALQMFAAMQ